MTKMANLDSHPDSYLHLRSPCLQPPAGTGGVTKRERGGFKARKRRLNALLPSFGASSIQPAASGVYRPPAVPSYRPVPSAPETRGPTTSLPDTNRPGPSTSAAGVGFVYAKRKRTRRKRGRGGGKRATDARRSIDVTRPEFRSATRPCPYASIPAAASRYDDPEPPAKRQRTGENNPYARVMNREPVVQLRHVDFTHHPEHTAASGYPGLSITATHTERHVRMHVPPSNFNSQAHSLEYFPPHPHHPYTPGPPDPPYVPNSQPELSTTRTPPFRAAGTAGHAPPCCVNAPPSDPRGRVYSAGRRGVVIPHFSHPPPVGMPVTENRDRSESPPSHSQRRDHGSEPVPGRGSLLPQHCVNAARITEALRDTMNQVFPERADEFSDDWGYTMADIIKNRKKITTQPLLRLFSSPYEDGPGTSRVHAKVMTESTPSDFTSDDHLAVPTFSQQEQQQLSFSDVVALDCEMVACQPDMSSVPHSPSKRGKNKRRKPKEVSVAGRCTIVDYHGKVLYDSYLRPNQPILSLRTRYSGITARDMQRATPIDDARLEILDILRGKLVVAHDISNDLEALAITLPPEAIRDTGFCVALRRRAGLSLMDLPSLKNLSLRLLGKEIQNGAHCSCVDSRTAMELYRCVEEEWEKEIVRSRIKIEEVETAT